MTNRKSLMRDSAGNATIELAIAAPMLVAMLIGLVDVSTAYSHKLQLEQVAQRTIEKVQQGGFKTTDVPTLEAEAEAAAGSGANATIEFWLECNGTKQTGTNAYTNGCANGATISRYVEIDIERTYTPLLISPTAGISSAGSFELHGVAGVRTQ